ncbi:MAG: hypothetical protein JWN70_3065 [Planctomycetaceae bacterium]|nr:hypothetical protein [Planctomycetaceae bacterium]
MAQSKQRVVLLCLCMGLWFAGFVEAADAKLEERIDHIVKQAGVTVSTPASPNHSPC